MDDKWMDSGTGELEELAFACLEAVDPRAELQRRAGDQPALFAAALRLMEQVSRLEQQTPVCSGDRKAPADGPRAGDPASWPQVPGVELLQLVARGGQGLVFRGRQSWLDRAVAVKLLAPELQTPAFVDRFRREARMLAGLQHPHIVACHDAGLTAAGQCYLVMEWIAGPNLSQWLERHGRLPAPAALLLARQLALALDHALASGLVHRDVKPDNVVLQPHEVGGPDGSFPFVPKLADLGLARPVQPGRGFTQLTPVGAILGTPMTMAPEQFDDPEHVDHRADIYGLGCVLYHALAGQPAFAGLLLTDLLKRKASLRAGGGELRIDGVAPEVVLLVERMLARAPEERPQTYAELLQALDALAAPPTRRRRLLWLPAAIAAVAALGWWAVTGGGSAAATEIVVAAPREVVEGSTATIGASLAGAAAAAPSPAFRCEQTAGPQVHRLDAAADALTFAVPHGTAGADLAFVVRDAADHERPVRLRVLPDPARTPLAADAVIDLFGQGEAGLLSQWRCAEPERWSPDESHRGALVHDPRGRAAAQRLLPSGAFELRGGIEPRCRYESPDAPRVPIRSVGLRLELAGHDALALVIEPLADERFAVRWQRQRLADSQWQVVQEVAACETAVVLGQPLRFSLRWTGARFSGRCGPETAPAEIDLQPARDWEVPWQPGLLEVHAEHGTAVLTDWVLAAAR